MATELQSIVSMVFQTSRIRCPVCSPDRKKQHEKTMVVTVEGNKKVYMCHHCGISGKFEEEPFYDKHLDQVVPIPTKLKTNLDLIGRFFSARGIDISNISSLPEMTTGEKYFNGIGKVDCVGFVYQDEAIKWRAIDHKAFTQDGAARNFYNLEKIADDMPETVIITEGEADTVALASIGLHSISVPNGAPVKVSNRKVSPEDDNKFGYIWEARDILDKAKQVIICADRDQPGEALSEEIARRVGRAKCWRVLIPESCKDITDVIDKLGAEQASELIENPAPFPLSGVYSASEYRSEIMEIFENGVGSGTSTGLDSVDELFTIAPGQLSIVTGIPSSGKSEFVDQIMMNLAMKHSWKFAIASFENPPKFHVAKMLEKYAEMPFFEGSRTRMSRKDLEEGMEFINQHFVFLESRDGSMPTVQDLIDRAKQAVMRLGIRGLVIDPYNMIDMNTEQEHVSISRMLSEITSFCKAHDIHVWFVAHPSKMRQKEDGTYPIPKGQNVSSSSAWHSKADIGVTVHRGDGGVEIHCWKCRFKWIGQQGMCYLDYDVPTGRYFDRSPENKIEKTFKNTSIKSHWMDDWK
jgi:twinkle protein